jgi:hypothetical protein
MGQLFHETFRYRFQLQRSLLLPPDAELDQAAKKISYESGLGPRPPGIEAWFTKLLAVPYVTRINTHYYNPDLPRANYFRRSTRGDISQIEGGFSDGAATTKFDILTTASNPVQCDAALSDLCERLLTG